MDSTLSTTKPDIYKTEIKSDTQFLPQKSSTPKRIFTIARNAFREAVRDRVLYNLIVFVLLITASAIFLGELTAGQEARTIANLGLSSILIFGAFISIFVGVSLVSKEIDRRTVFAIFSKPIGRGEFVIGKYLGLCLTLLVNVSVMSVGVMLALIYVGGNQLIASIWAATFLIFVELAILTAVATLFSAFSSPALSALLTFCVFIIGNFSASLREFAAGMNSNAARVFFDFLYYFLPNFSIFSFITNAARGEMPSMALLATAFCYGVVYIAILQAATVLIFKNRNFK